MEYSTDDALDRTESQLDDLYVARDQLESAIERAEDDFETAVADRLYDIQDALDPDEEVTLVRSGETSRGGSFRFREVLTPDGVVVRDVTGNTGTYEGERFSSDALYGWADGHYWTAEPTEEPLDTKSEYLTWKRAQPDYLRKLADRIHAIEAGDDRVPAHMFYYD